jgi:hypothetical protein
MFPHGLEAPACPGLSFALGPVAFAVRSVQADCRRCTSRILHLEPVPRATATVGGILALRDDAFKTHFASVHEDGRTVALDICSLNRMPGRALAEIDASVALRTGSGSPRRSSPFNSIRSKAYRNGSSSS